MYTNENLSYSVNACFCTTKCAAINFFKILVIIGNQLTADVLTRFLNNLGTDVGIKVAIGVDNESGYQWKVPGFYFDSGTSDNILPSNVASGKIIA